MSAKRGSQRLSRTPTIVLVLGAPNNPQGRLSRIAVSRAKAALQTYRKNRGSKFFLTGGYGQHFNTAPRPHAYYVARYLARNGVPPEDILGSVLSSNTIEDALMVKKVAEARGKAVLHVVTSDFHIRRARVIFKRVFKGWRTFFVPAETDVAEEEMRLLRQHERDALRRLQTDARFVRLKCRSRTGIYPPGCST
jgi:uncharacterized SAM-binding protein YcdF (DUF218 family)